MTSKLTRWLLFRRFFSPLMVLFVLIIIGTIGYVLIDDYGWINALFMTVITVATVGFGETEPLSDAGKIFTVLLIIASLATVAYYITSVTRLLLDGEWRKQYHLYLQEKKLNSMENHVIVCGYGRNGHQACEVLAQNHVPYVIIEQREQYTDALPTSHPLLVKGDATRDEVLLEAGLMKARALISALPSDADNLFVVLTARQLNPNLAIISRASDDHSISKLKIAGATNVIMPDKLGGANMASLALIPDVHELLSMLFTSHTEKFRVGEITISKPAMLGNLNIWQQTGCTVLGIRLKDGSYLANPQPDYETSEGERLIVMGSTAVIRKAKKLVESGTA